MSRPTIGFFPVGFVGLFGLAAVFAVAWVPVSQKVERTVRSRAEAELRGRGFDWVELAVEGQTVTLSGIAPTPEAGEEAIAVVEAIEVPTLAGAMSPVGRVVARFEAPPPPPPAPVTWTDFAFRLDRGVLVLDGAVPDDEYRRQVVRAGNMAIAPPRLEEVDDRPLVVRPPGREPAGALAVRAAELLGRCTTGRAELRDGRFAFACELPEAAAAEVAAAARAPAPPAELGLVEVVALEALLVCARALEDAPPLSPPALSDPPGFDPASLDAVAAAARSCPGRVAIEVQVDPAQPDAGAAQAVAESLRDALVERGLDASSLVAAVTTASSARAIVVRPVRIDPTVALLENR